MEEKRRSAFNNFLASFWKKKKSHKLKEKVDTTRCLSSAPPPLFLFLATNFPSSPKNLFYQDFQIRFFHKKNLTIQIIAANDRYLSSSEFSPVERLFREMEHKGYRGLEGSDRGSFDDYNRSGTKVRGGYERHVRAGRRGGEAEERALDEHGGRGKSLNDIPSGPSSATQR